MKNIAVISDIHGNFPALEAVLDDISQNNVAQIICLGDLVGFYCMVNEVIDTIRALEIKTIIGNHDYALAFNNGVIARSKTCTFTLQRQLEEISSENLFFLRNNQPNYNFEYADKTYFCAHGGLNDAIDEYLHKPNYEYFEKADFKYDFLLTGHTHLPKILNFGNYNYANSGSVGQPRDKNNKASYLLIKEDEMLIKRVAYNIDKIVTQMKKSGYDDYISEILYRGVRIGE